MAARERSASRRRARPAVDDLIALVGAVDGILQAQAAADADYFVAVAGRTFTADETAAVHAGVLKAYRWQYIVSGVIDPRFQQILFEMIDDAQRTRIMVALEPLLYAMPALTQEMPKAA